jgi:hypothetical protein
LDLVIHISLDFSNLQGYDGTIKGHVYRSVNYRKADKQKTIACVANKLLYLLPPEDLSSGTGMASQPLGSGNSTIKIPSEF